MRLRLVTTENRTHVERVKLLHQQHPVCLVQLGWRLKVKASLCGALWDWHKCFFPPPAQNVLIPTQNVSLSLVLDDYSIMERWSHGIVYYLPHTHTPTHTHTHTYAGMRPNIQIGPKDTGRLHSSPGPNKKIKFDFSMLRPLGMF